MKKNKKENNSWFCCCPGNKTFWGILLLLLGLWYLAKDLGWISWNISFWAIALIFCGHLEYLGTAEFDEDAREEAEAESSAIEYGLNH